jgi:oxygen-independent coproporphyrinogen III oxidase
MKQSAIYVHIPFCDHKCIYCDFYSIITSDNIDPFFYSLKKEIDHYSRKYQDSHHFNSIFFGGGTPSLMCPEDISNIITCLKAKFKFADNIEITLETNPGTVTDEKLKHFLDAGVNRLSIGIQSFDDEDLRFLTRIHDRQTAVDTIQKAHEAGYSNINIDLIFNLPGQTKEKWLNNLSQAVDLPVTHISAYSLILERGTILNKLVLDGIVTMQDADYDADLYEYTINYLNSKGFKQYEVSNFARKKNECIHNLSYWRYRDYIGLGPSAHSFMEGKRWWNYSSLKRYILEIEKNNHAEASFEIPTAEEQMNEYIMLALRSYGIELNELNVKFGLSWFKNNKAFLEKLTLEGFIHIEKDIIKLTPKGYPVCDEIAARFKS